MLKIVIVEDDLMIADMAEEMLVKSGYEVCGIARTVPEAIALCRLHEPDLAVIDLRLADGGLGTEVVQQLDGPGKLGVLYATGNAWHPMLTTADGHACLAKPYRGADLARSLEIVAGMVRTGTASQPFPAGFELLPLPPCPTTLQDT
jgi:CheY-like chemotaxis protein